MENLEFQQNRDFMNFETSPFIDELPSLNAFLSEQEFILRIKETAKRCARDDYQYRQQNKSEFSKNNSIEKPKRSIIAYDEVLNNNGYSLAIKEIFNRAYQHEKKNLEEGENENAIQCDINFPSKTEREYFEQIGMHGLMDSIRLDEKGSSARSK